MSNIDQDIESILAQQASKQPPQQSQSVSNIDADLDEILSGGRQQAGGQQQFRGRTGSFGQQLFSTEPVEKPVNLPVDQDIIMAFSPDKSTTAKFLQSKHPNSQVALDESGNITIDGKQIDSSGFNAVLQNLGYGINIIPQIVGSLVGGAAGMAGGAGAFGVGAIPGAMAGAFSGGVAGNVAGNTLRLLIGDALGLSPDGEAFLQSTIDETQQAAIGEGLAFGLPVAGVAIKRAARPSIQAIQKSLNSGKADVAKKTTTKAMTFGQEAAKDMLKFVASVDDVTATRVLREGPNKVFSEQNFDEQRFFNIAKETLFKNKERVNRLSDMKIDEPATRGGLSVGQDEIFQMLKEGDSRAYRELLAELTNLSSDEINDLAMLKAKKLMAESIDEKALVALSKSGVDLVEAQRKKLGDIIGAKVKEYVKNDSKERFNLGNLSKQIDDYLRKNQFVVGVKEKGFVRQKPVNVPGVKELMELNNIFKGITEESVKAGKPVKVAMSSLSKKNAVKINDSVDILVDSIMSKTEAPPQILEAAKGIRKLFKDEYYSQLGLKDEVAKFAKFAELMDDLPKTSSQAEKYFESRIKSLPENKGSAIEKDRFLEAIGGVDKEIAEKYKEQLTTWVSGNALKRVSAKNAFHSLAESLSRPSFLDVSRTTPAERILKQISTGMAKSRNPVIANKGFEDAAMDAIAARQFTKNSQGLLRLGAMLSIIGVGSLKGGPIGTAVGLGAVSALKPSRIAQYLKSVEKPLRKVGVVGKAEVKKAAEAIKKNQFKPKPKGKYSTRDIGLSALGAILTRKDRE